MAHGRGDPPAVQAVGQALRRWLAFFEAPLVALFLPTVLRWAVDRLAFADLVEDFLAFFLTVFLDVALAFAALALVALALVALALVALALVGLALVALDFLTPPFAALAVVVAAFLTDPGSRLATAFLAFFAPALTAVSARVPAA